MLRSGSLLLSLAVAASAQTPQLPAHVTQELLCERPAKDHWGPPWTEVGQASDDLGKVAWLSRRGGPWVLLVNGQEVGPPLDDPDFQLSSDARHTLRTGRQAKSWSVWVDGKQIAGPFDDVKGARFVAGASVVFAARRGKTWTWFRDGAEQPLTGVGADTPAVSADGKRIAYPVLQADGWHMVQDGNAGPAFERLAAGSFSPDATRFAYLGLRKGTLAAVVDGKEGPAFAGIDGLRFSADSKRVAYLAVSVGKSSVDGRIVADGTAGQPYSAMILNMDEALRRARSDLNMFGLWRRLDDRPLFTGSSVPVFGADGKIVHAARTGAEEGIFFEGDSKPRHAAAMVVAGPIVSADARKVAWVDSSKGRLSAFVDGQPGPSVATIEKRSNGAWELSLSADGSRVAFVHVAGGSGFTFGPATHALRQLVVTGHEERSYDSEQLTNPRFSADGKHVAYEVHGAKGYEVPSRKYGSFVVVDGIAGRVYSQILSGSMRFVGPAVSYVARVQEGDKNSPYRYYRVTQRGK